MKITLWRGKEQIEDRPGEFWVNRKYRNDITFGLSWEDRFIWLGLEPMAVRADSTADVWTENGHTGVYGISITPHFAFGPFHMYYDGPHCAFDFGFVHILWTNWNCKKCHI